MKSFILLLLTVFFVSNCNEAFTQNAIILKDRYIRDTSQNATVYTRYYNSELYQARIIGQNIYTIEVVENESFMTSDMWLNKYDLAGNVLKRIKLPFQPSSHAGQLYFHLHSDQGTISIFPTNTGIIFYYPAYTNFGDTVQSSRHALFKYSYNLDSIIFLSWQLPKHSYLEDTIQQTDAPGERYIKRLNDGNFLLVTGENNYGRRLWKFDENFNTIFNTVVDTLIKRTRYYLGTSTHFKSSEISEENGSFKYYTLHTNIHCYVDRILDTSCNHIGIFDLHIMTINQNGVMVKDDSINITYPVNAVEKVIPVSNGYRVFFSGNFYDDQLHIADYDSISKTWTEKYNSGDFDVGRVSSPYLSKGYSVFTMVNSSYRHKFYQYNSDFTSAAFNPYSVTPLPDNYYQYVYNRLQKVNLNDVFWIDEDVDSSLLVLATFGLNIPDSGSYNGIVQIPTASGKYKVNVFKDNIKNCVQDGADTPYKNQIVEIKKTSGLPYSFYQTTDANGRATIMLDSGSYNTKVISAINYWGSCPPYQSFSLSTNNDSVLQTFMLQRLIVCPKLTVDISNWRLRTCRTAYYTVSFCNNGTAAAVSPYVVIQFDSLITVDSATRPYTKSGNTYTFQLPTLPEDICGTFYINGTLSCNAPLGASHCVTAHIYPDSICTPVSAAWDRSNINVDGRCTGDSVQFKIKNIGFGNMSVPKTYIVSENDVVSQPVSFQLNSGEQLFVSRAANGSTMRLTAEQADSFPYPNTPTAVVEGCNGFSPGFVNVFPSDEDAEFISTNCTQNSNSNDPNEKAAVPTGITSDHKILRSTSLHYQINFQNTGNDTAYDIVVYDTLSPLLNMGTLKMGTASHPYTYEVYGNAILKLTFRNINLLDSLHNEAYSHGYFTYHITPVDTVHNGDRIYNTAYIYFDGNKAVQTNTTLHTITNNFFNVVSSVAPGKSNIGIQVQPNPFNEQCTITVRSTIPQDGLYDFKLYSIDGKLIRQTQMKDQITLDAKDLVNSMYLFRIEQKGVLIGTGKLVKQN